MSNADDKWLETLRSKVESAPVELPEGGAEAFCATVARLQRRRRLARSFVALGSAAAAALALFLLLPSEPADPQLIASDRDSAVLTAEPAETPAVEAETIDTAPQKLAAMTPEYSSEKVPEQPAKKAAGQPVETIQVKAAEKPQELPEEKSPEKPVNKSSEPTEPQLDLSRFLAMADSIAEQMESAARRSRRISAGVHFAFDGAASGTSASSASSGTAVSQNSGHQGTYRTASSLFKGYHTEYEHFKPLNLGLTLSFGLNDMLSLETGLEYSHNRSVKHNYLNTIELGQNEQTIHFIGIPLGLRLTAFEAGRNSLYGYAGLMTQKCLYASWDGNKLDINPVVLSSHFSAGYQFAISDLLGLYVEPGISHFDAVSDASYTIYSQRPWQFELRAGLRFSM